MKASRNDILKATLLAIVFGLLGTIPWILVSSSIHFYVSFLSFLIGYATYYGFTKGIGDKKYSLKYLTWLIILVIIFATLFAEAASVIIQMKKEGIPVDAFFINLLLHDDKFMNHELGNLAIGYFIAFFGLSGILKKIKFLNAAKTQPEAQAATVAKAEVK